MPEKVMDTTKVIKYLAVSEILLIIIYVILSLSLESALPELLQQYLRQEENAEMSGWELFGLFGGLVYLLLYPITITGLILIKPWAKKAYILVAVSSFVLLPFMGPYVDHAIPATIDTLGSAVEGAILALLLFSDSAFNKKVVRDKMLHISPHT